MAMQVRDDVGAPRVAAALSRRRGQRHPPVVGVTAALDDLGTGQCLEVDEPTGPMWGYQRASDAGKRWPDRLYTASRAGGVWRIWRVR